MNFHHTEPNLPGNDPIDDHDDKDDKSVWGKTADTRLKESKIGLGAADQRLHKFHIEAYKHWLAVPGLQGWAMGGRGGWEICRDVFPTCYSFYCGGVILQRSISPTEIRWWYVFFYFILYSFVFAAGFSSYCLLVNYTACGLFLGARYLLFPLVAPWRKFTSYRFLNHRKNWIRCCLLFTKHFTHFGHHFHEQRTAFTNLTRALFIFIFLYHTLFHSLAREAKPILAWVYCYCIVYTDRTFAITHMEKCFFRGHFISYHTHQMLLPHAQKNTNEFESS